MRSFLSALRANWAGFGLVGIIVLLGLYLLKSPQLEDAARLIDQQQYDDASRLLGRMQKGLEGMAGDERGRLRWLLARLALRRNQARGSLTIGDLRDCVALLRQAREDYLSGAARKVPAELYDDWLAATRAFQQVHGHEEAVELLGELARFTGNPPRLMLARATLERDRPGGDHAAALALLGQYLALKLGPAQRRAGLIEQAATYRSRAEAGEIQLGLNGGARSATGFDRLLAIAERIDEDYKAEQGVREKLLAEATEETERQAERFETGRLSFRRARVGSLLLRYLRMSSRQSSSKLVQKLRAQVAADLARATKQLEQYVAGRSQTELPRAYYLLGDSARLLGKYDEALAAFRKLEGLADQPPIDAIYLSLLGKARVGIEQGRFADVEQAGPQLEGLASGPAQQYELAGLFEEYRARRMAAFDAAREAALEQARREAKSAAELQKLRQQSITAAAQFDESWKRRTAELYAGAARGKSPAQAAEAALRAQELFAVLGNDAAAIQACDRFIELGARDPRISRTLLQKGQHLLRIGLGRDAIAAFRENQRRFPNTPYAYDSLLAIGDAYLVLGEPEQGLDHYRRIRENDERFSPAAPIWRDALYREGAGQVQAGLAARPLAKDRLQRGVALQQEFVRRYPTQPLVRQAEFHQALGLLGLGRWREADKLLAVLAETPVRDGDPDPADRRRIHRLSNYLHGLAYLAQVRASGQPSPRDLQQAINILETAIERFDETPQAVWASVQLVGLYHEVGADPQARRASRRALWLARKVGPRTGFDPGFWTRWVEWKASVLLDRSAAR